MCLVFSEQHKTEKVVIDRKGKDTFLLSQPSCKDNLYSRPDPFNAPFHSLQTFCLKILVEFLPFQVLVEHEGTVTAVAVTNSCEHVVSGSADNKILIWNLSTGTVQNHLTGHSGTITALRLTNDGNVLISGNILLH